MRLGRGLLAAAILSAAVAACGAPTTTPGRLAGHDRLRRRVTSATPLPSHIGSVGPFSPADCPIPEAAFCTPAADLADAIVAGDAAAIVGAQPARRVHVRGSRRLDLHRLRIRPTSSRATRSGRPAATSGSFAPAAYRSELQARMEAIDPSYSDDAGTGESPVLGTSACGPDDPADVPTTLPGPPRDEPDPATSSASSGSTSSPSATTSGGRHPLSGHRRLVAGTPRRAAPRRRLWGLAVGSRLTTRLSRT